jgi:hypothetical protein
LISTSRWIGSKAEVLVRPVESDHAGTVENVFEFIRSLPSGTRTREDIDRQIAEERDSWGERWRPTSTHQPSSTWSHGAEGGNTLDTGATSGERGAPGASAKLRTQQTF